jgi:hypothetical protein
MVLFREFGGSRDLVINMGTLYIEFGAIWFTVYE